MSHISRGKMTFRIRKEPGVLMDSPSVAALLTILGPVDLEKPPKHLSRLSELP